METTRVRAQLDRILASVAFRHARRASGFLRFVVDRTLDGRAHEIKESLIAVEILGRGMYFDSKTDPIVRVEAARLRDRLRTYYERHATHDDVLISLPKGGYVPEFAEREPTAPRAAVDVLRLSVLAPGNAVFDAFAISPDGRRLAFTADVGGRTMLWVRDLDALDALPLPGTEAAAFPFWSPDGQSLGFFTPFKLRIIPAVGGPCRDVADVVLGRGAAWNRDGAIVFCPRPVGALYRVPASGGTPHPVTTLDAARAEISHGFPQFLPDGRRFVYFAASGRPGESGVRIGSLDSPRSTAVVTAETSALYAPRFGGRAGCLLFVSHDTLYAQPLDDGTLELTGRRDVVAAAVRYRPWGQAGMSVADDGLLLYRAGTNADHQFTWVDRRGATVATVGARNRLAASPHASFALSPDGRRVALHRPDDPDTALSTLWVMDLDRGGASWRFTEAGGEEAEFCPVWSSDGGALVFSRGDDRGMRIVRRALTGGPTTSLVATPGPKFPTDWSDDGRFVAYNSQAPDYRYQRAWVASLTGDEPPQPLLRQTYHAGSARFAPVRAPGGPRWLAYTSDETGRHEIYLRSFPDDAYRVPLSSDGGCLPQWRRDGRELFYLAPDGSLMAVAVDLEAAEFGPPRALCATGLRLNPYSVWMTRYGVAPDGERILLNCPADASPAALTALVPR